GMETLDEIGEVGLQLWAHLTRLWADPVALSAPVSTFRQDAVLMDGIDIARKRDHADFGVGNLLLEPSERPVRTEIIDHLDTRELGVRQSFERKFVHDESAGEADDKQQPSAQQSRP